jgi:hypothetical protein
MDERLDLVQKCVKYMEEKGLSQARLANLIGIGESTFSRWLKGNYPNPEAINHKVIAFFEKESIRQEVLDARDIGFAMTGISQNVWQVLEYCRIQKTIGVVYGDAGIGKTRTAQEWSKDKPDVVMVTVNPAFNSPKAFLKLLAKQLKTIRNGSMDDVYMDVLDKLTGADKTIVIDEAQHLTHKALEIVRSINDSTNTAIILIGNAVVYSKLLGKQQAEFAQLFSRIGMRSHLLTDVFTKKDVVSVFGDQEEEVLDFLLNICKSKFGLRGAIHVFVNAQNNKDLSAKGVRAMAKLMGILV